MGVPQSGSANGVTGAVLPGIANACGPHPFRGRKSSVFQGFSKNAQKPAGASRASSPRPQQKFYSAPWRRLSSGSCLLVRVLACLHLCFESMVIHHKPPTSILELMEKRNPLPALQSYQSSLLASLFPLGCTRTSRTSFGQPDLPAFLVRSLE